MSKEENKAKATEEKKAKETKPKTSKENQTKLKRTKTYTIQGTGKGRLGKGVKTKVSGGLAQIVIDKGYAEIVK